MDHLHLLSKHTRLLEELVPSLRRLPSRLWRPSPVPSSNSACRSSSYSLLPYGRSASKWHLADSWSLHVEPPSSSRRLPFPSAPTIPPPLSMEVFGWSL